MKRPRGATPSLSAMPNHQEDDGYGVVGMEADVDVDVDEEMMAFGGSGGEPWRGVLPRQLPEGGGGRDGPFRRRRAVRRVLRRGAAAGDGVVERARGTLELNRGGRGSAA